MIKVGIVGSTGRMGKHLIKNVIEDDALALAVVHVFDELKETLPKETLVTNDMEKVVEVADVIVDFSAPAATEALCEAVLKNPTPIVVATTGFTPHQQNLLAESAKVAPVLYSTNMSVGIALLKQLVEDVSSKLRDFDIEIVEMHHRHK
ncbi:MAG TPA: 4-hydroxy-tetrahydrodipicolinate reductase, partial [Nitratifractor sp.]|nr:4-hydroxy-tetrahydrodipicolinate reductase [Nitratifractor sp.]